MESLKHKEIIRLSKSSLDSLEKKAVMDVLDKEFLGMGDEVQEFEKALFKFFNRPAVCVSTGTAALHLALQASGIGEGHEVLVQSLTYVASFQAISATGARPISCEIDPSNMCIDLKDAKKRITANTRAIMPVHYSGGVGHLEETYKFAQENNLRVIEDAAHAFGTEFKGKKVGSFGDITCFSFDGIKNITSGEGGCIITEDQEVLEKIRDARLLGVEKDSEKRFSGKRSWNFDVSQQGWRYHMSNIMAAIGLVQLSKFDKIAKKRRELAKYYLTKLSNSQNIKLLSLDYDSVVPHIFVIEISKDLHREEIREKLLRRGIQTGIHYQPNHWLTYYKDSKAKSLKITDQIFNRLITLPLHTDLSKEDVDYICSSLNEVIS